jgi:hypothetical protein
MVYHCREESPDEPDPDRDYHERPIIWWNEFDSSGDPGATTRKVLEEIRLQVTECLNRHPPDWVKVASLTAKAFHSIAGNQFL